MAGICDAAPAPAAAPAAKEEKKPKPAAAVEKTEVPAAAAPQDDAEDEAAAENAEAETAAIAKPVSPDPVRVYGWREYILIHGVAEKLKAKLDTGALTSSIHAEEKELFERDGKKWVRFIVTDPGLKKPVRTRIEAPLVRIAKVKEPGAESVAREVVRLSFQIGERKMRGEFTLNNRNEHACAGPDRPEHHQGSRLGGSRAAPISRNRSCCDDFRHVRTPAVMRCEVEIDRGGGFSGPARVAAWPDTRRCRWGCRSGKANRSTNGRSRRGFRFSPPAKRVKARLSLPAAAVEQRSGQESGSLGYHYNIERNLGEYTAVWAAENREDSQALYFRVRFPDATRSGGEPVPAEAPEPDNPGFSGPSARLRKHCQPGEIGFTPIRIRCSSRCSTRSAAASPRRSSCW